MGRLTCAVVAIILLAGCGDDDAPNEGDSGTRVEIVTLEDGTRCAFADGTNGKALDCDWATPAGEGE